MIMNGSIICHFDAVTEEFPLCGTIKDYFILLYLFFNYICSIP